MVLIPLLKITRLRICDERGNQKRQHKKRRCCRTVVVHTNAPTHGPYGTRVPDFPNRFPQLQPSTSSSRSASRLFIEFVAPNQTPNLGVCESAQASSYIQ